MNTLLRSFQNQDTIAITSTTAMTINAISPSPLLLHCSQQITYNTAAGKHNNYGT